MICQIFSRNYLFYDVSHVIKVGILCLPLNLIRKCNFMKNELFFKQGLTVNFLFQGAVNFALMMSQMEGGCPVDYNTITDLFLQVCILFLCLS